VGVPTLVLIAGPNGAGKTTFASEYLSIDEGALSSSTRMRSRAARLLTPLVGGSDIRAGRMMLDRIDELVDAGSDFVIETTLATLIYARKIPCGANAATRCR
jgi:predicted ABC-type ATPase